MKIKIMMRMPITMMLVMMVILETFVRSASPVYQRRSEPSAGVDTRSAYHSNLTRGWRP